MYCAVQCAACRLQGSTGTYMNATGVSLRLTDVKSSDQSRSLAKGGPTRPGGGPGEGLPRHRMHLYTLLLVRSTVQPHRALRNSKCIQNPYCKCAQHVVMRGNARGCVYAGCAGKVGVTYCTHVVHLYSCALARTVHCARYVRVGYGVAAGVTVAAGVAATFTLPRTPMCLR